MLLTIVICNGYGSRVYINNDLVHRRAESASERLCDFKYVIVYESYVHCLLGLAGGKGHSCLAAQVIYSSCAISQ